MLCTEDSATLTDYVSLITQSLDEPLTNAPERQLEASILDAIETYLDLRSEVSIAAEEQGLLLLMIPQELTYILDRVLARCLRDWGTELPFNLQPADDGKPGPELVLSRRATTEESIKKIADWVEQSTPTADMDDKRFLDRLLLLLLSWLRQKSMEKSIADFHRKSPQKSSKKHNDGPSL